MQIPLPIDPPSALTRLDLPTDAPFRPRDAPVSPATLHRLLNHGHLRRLVRGVVVNSQLPDTLGLRARALALVVPEGAVVTDRTAAWLHGVDVLMPGEQKTVPPVSVFHRDRGRLVRLTSVQSGQRMMPARDIIRVDGVRVTTPLRTALDLGRLEHRDRALAALDAFLHAGLDHERLLAELERFKGYRGVIQLRSLAPIADAGAQSPPESITRLRWMDCSHAPPLTTQIPVIGPDGVTWFLDVGSEGLMMAIEYDGQEFHSEPERQRHDRERREWIAENTPWTVHVITQRHLFGRERNLEFLIPGWMREARATLGQRLTRSGWTAYDLGG